MSPLSFTRINENISPRKELTLEGDPPLVRMKKD
jgi:hypothetical protein